MNDLIKITLWKRIEGSNNMLLETDDFYISYNPIAGSSAGVDDPTGIGALAQTLGGILTGEGDPQEETALYDHDKWRILKGDFRKEYEDAFPKGLQACIKVYEANISHRSAWSSSDV